MFSENKRNFLSSILFRPKAVSAQTSEVRYHSSADLFSTAICAAQQPPTAQLQQAAIHPDPLWPGLEPVEAHPGPALQSALGTARPRRRRSSASSLGVRAQDSMGVRAPI
jgi:hypothetical protein